MNALDHATDARLPAVEKGREPESQAHARTASITRSRSSGVMPTLEGNVSPRA